MEEAEGALCRSMVWLGIEDWNPQGQSGEELGMIPCCLEQAVGMGSRMGDCH